MNRRNEILAAIADIHAKCEDDGAFGRCSLRGAPLPAEICDAGIALRALVDSDVAGADAALLPSFRAHYRNARRPNVCDAPNVDIAAICNAVHAYKRAVKREYAGRDEAHNIDLPPTQRVHWYRELPRLERAVRAARADVIATVASSLGIE